MSSQLKLGVQPHTHSLFCSVLPGRCAACVCAESPASCSFLRNVGPSSPLACWPRVRCSGCTVLRQSLCGEERTAQRAVHGGDAGIKGSPGTWWYTSVWTGLLPPGDGRAGEGRRYNAEPCGVAHLGFCPGVRSWDSEAGVPSFSKRQRSPGLDSCAAGGPRGSQDQQEQNAAMPGPLRQKAAPQPARLGQTARWACAASLGTGPARNSAVICLVLAPTSLALVTVLPVSIRRFGYIFKMHRGSLQPR